MTIVPADCETDAGGFETKLSESKQNNASQQLGEASATFPNLLAAIYKSISAKHEVYYINYLFVIIRSGFSFFALFPGLRETPQEMFNTITLR